MPIAPEFSTKLQDYLNSEDCSAFQETAISFARRPALNHRIQVNAGAGTKEFLAVPVPGVVCISNLHPRQYESLLREMQFMQSIQHPSVPKVYTIRPHPSSEGQGTILAYAEWIDMATLPAEGIAWDDKMLSATHKAEIVRVYCEVQAQASKQDLVVVDTKSDSFGITPSDEVKFFDLMVRKKEAYTGDNGLTVEGVVYRADWQDALAQLFGVITSLYQYPRSEASHFALSKVLATAFTNSSPDSLNDLDLALDSYRLPPTLRNSLLGFIADLNNRTAFDLESIMNDFAADVLPAFEPHDLLPGQRPQSKSIDELLVPVEVILGRLDDPRVPEQIVSRRELESFVRSLVDGLMTHDDFMTHIQHALQQRLPEEALPSQNSSLADLLTYVMGKITHNLPRSEVIANYSDQQLVQYLRYHQEELAKAKGMGSDQVRDICRILILSTRVADQDRNASIRKIVGVLLTASTKD